jgi:hypothetical protein
MSIATPGDIDIDNLAKIVSTRIFHYQLNNSSLERDTI